LAQQEKTPSGFWAWEPPGKSIRILIDLTLVDRILAASVDGLGAVPKRGAEIGGIIIGERPPAAGGIPEILLTDWIPVPCAHRFGPSFVLSPEEHQALEAALEAAGKGAVGYFRSHTREGLAPSAEDLQICQKYFPDPANIVLLVRPSVMKVSTAGFFCYENGSLQDATPLEFPFRRSELETGEAPARRPLGERRPPPPVFDPPVAAVPEHPPRESAQPVTNAHSPSSARKQHGMEAIAGIAESVSARAAAQSQSESASPQRALAQQQQQPPHPLLPYPAPSLPAGRIRRNWVWFPLSFVFLLLGVLLGFQAALVFTSGKPASSDPYSLSLGVERRGDDLSIRWDRNNPAIRTASKGVLDIQDGRFSKRVDLDSSQLQTGSVIYRFSSNDVRFRLEVHPRDRIVIMETVDWKGK
jgi:proteasome lid subunit RPN8/RPN11